MDLIYNQTEQFPLIMPLNVCCVRWKIYARIVSIYQNARPSWSENSSPRSEWLLFGDARMRTLHETLIHLKPFKNCFDFATLTQPEAFPMSTYKWNKPLKMILWINKLIEWFMASIKELIATWQICWETSTGRQNSFALERFKTIYCHPMFIKKPSSVINVSEGLHHLPA